MLRIAVGLLIVTIFIPAHAEVYKCTVAGTLVFQEAPCPGTKFERPSSTAGARPQAAPSGASVPTAAPAPTGAASTSPNALKDRLAAYERERHIREGQQQVETLQHGILDRNSQMSRELAALSQKKTHAANNLAGAQWESSISAEMSAVTEKSRTLNEADQDQIAELRSQIADWRRGM